MMKGLFGIFPTDHIRDLGIGEISLQRDSCHLYLKTLIIIIIIIIIYGLYKPNDVFKVHVV